MPSALLLAVAEGNEWSVRRLLRAGNAADERDPESGWLPIHFAAATGHVGIGQQLVEAAAATLMGVNKEGLTRLHIAAVKCHTPVMELLVEAAPSTVTAVDFSGCIPLDYALRVGTESSSAARCLVRAAPAVQPTFCSMLNKRQDAATLYADLVSRLPLTQQEWQSIPAPCPDLVRVLPDVLMRSVAEAGWLVGRLEQEQRARLRTGALCLGRMAARVHGAPSLPAQLSQRISVAAMVPPMLPAAADPRARGFFANLGCFFSSEAVCIALFTAFYVAVEPGARGIVHKIYQALRPGRH